MLCWEDLAMCVVSLLSASAPLAPSCRRRWQLFEPARQAQGWCGDNRAFIKTVTYQTIAVTLDFTTHYVVVGNLATAAALSAFGFVVSPFVYSATRWPGTIWLA